MNIFKKLKNKIKYKVMPIRFGNLLDRYSLEYVNNIYNLEKEQKKEIVSTILSAHVDITAADEIYERGMPSDPRYSQDSYYHVMLKRYFFAGAEFCRGKTVLDTCCGYGWGAYILSNYAKNVCAVDSDARTIETCRRLWRAENIKWLKCDALEMTGVECLFDVVIGMETIEHFDCDEGQTYLSQVNNRLKKNGILILTSSFPHTQDDAESLLKTNSYHKMIYTHDHINELVGKYFREFVIVNNWMCIARK